MWKKELLFMLLGFVMNFYAIGQDAEEKGWIIGGNLSVSRASVIDESFSSIPYQGFLPGGSLYVGLVRRNLLHELQIGFSTGKLAMKDNKDYSLNQIYSTIDYTALLEPGQQNGRVIYKLGGGMNAFLARRNYDHFVNKELAYEFVSSLSAVGEICWYLGDEAGSPRISNRLTFPLVSWAVQPGLANEKGKDFRRTDLLFVNDLLRIKNLISLTVDISTHQQLSLGYTWDYYQIKQGLAKRQANHFAGITYSVHL